MRTLGAAFLAASLIISSAFAETAMTSSAPLAPGKPAGVKQAQMHGHWAYWLLAGGVLGTGIVFLASGSGNNSVTPATTTGTP